MRYVHESAWDPQHYGHELCFRVSSCFPWGAGSLFVFHDVDVSVSSGFRFDPPYLALSGQR